jgi:hypothetical protein
MKLTAYCDSDICTNVVIGMKSFISKRDGRMKQAKKYKKVKSVVKEVSVHETFCPECGSALFWVRDEESLQGNP